MGNNRNYMKDKQLKMMRKREQKLSRKLKTKYKRIEKAFNTILIRSYSDTLCSKLINCK